MKLKLNLVSIFAVAVIVFYSCAPAYVPNVVNAPMLTNKGEVQVALHTGTSGFDPQFAYAITNNIGIMANASFMNATSDSSDSFHKHSFGEFGVGYLKALGQRGKFETFAGYGRGKIQALYENNLWTSTSKVDISRFFIQPTIGLTSKVVDLGFSTRFSFVSITDGTDKASQVFAEPALTAKLGWDHIKIVSQLGISLPLNQKLEIITYQPLLFSLGLMGNFGKVFK